MAEVMANAAVRPRVNIDLGRLAMWAVIGAALVVLVGRVGADPFGDSFDGYNAEVWTSGADALRDDPLGSRLGAIHDDGRIYMTHPPLIILETAAARSLLGASTFASRVPAWGGLIVAAWLVYRLLQRLRVGRAEAAAGAAVMVTLPMTATFGAMLDTPVTSMPFGVWCLLAWVRYDQGDATRWEWPVTCGLAVLAGWQAALLAGLTSVIGRSWRAAGGVGVGVAAITAWHLWMFGDLRVLVAAAVHRSGDGGTPLAEGLPIQWDAVVDLLTPLGVLLAVVGFAVGWSSRDRRRLIAAVGITVAAYPVMMKGGLEHSYWLYWCILPIGLGAAFLAADRPDVRRLVLCAPVALLALSLWAPTAEMERQASGLNTPPTIGSDGGFWMEDGRVTEGRRP